MNAKDRLILALDVRDPTEAWDLIKKTQNHVGLYKVGLQLFLRGGWGFIEDLGKVGINVMLDLKLHDIPNTVAEATRQICDLPNVKLFTAHASGGPKMIAAAREVLDESGSDAKMLGVTVLTSHDVKSLVAIGYCDSEPPHPPVNIPLLTTKLAHMAADAGANGLVCSPCDLSYMRSHKVSRTGIVKMPAGTFYVCPGIREPDAPKDDQSRTLPPRQAVLDGAKYIVVGRPIRKADDPACAAERFVTEIKKGLGYRSGAQP